MHSTAYLARAARRASAATILALCSVISREVRAEDELSEAELSRLQNGEQVVRQQTFEIDQKRYVGGIVYVVIAAPAEQVAALFSDPVAMQEIVPRTQSIERVGVAGEDAILEFCQGNSLIHARYAIRLRAEPEANRIRFWLDRTRHHAIEDAWGFLRYQPFTAPSGPSVLVSYGILVDLGPGMVRSLYEERLRALALTLPLRLREYVLRNRSKKPENPV